MYKQCSSWFPFRVQLTKREREKKKHFIVNSLHDGMGTDVRQQVTSAEVHPGRAMHAADTGANPLIKHLPLIELQIIGCALLLSITFRPSLSCESSLFN
jgi:hypothetical protein